MTEDDQNEEDETLRMGRIGSYRLLRPLGEGAMARVYLAELDALGGFRRKVALKVVRPEYARDEKFVLLLAREAMIGSRLQHPNIVQTLEFNEHGDRHFLALQFVEGETLADLLKKAAEDGQEGLPRVLVLESMIQVLKGLAYAHDLKAADGVTPLGIIHRDLKPGNIMLSRHGQVKVMDFGIAKAKVAAAKITTVGQVRGTPIYMAPEQVTGQDLDGRTDQFAAATVMYELLTGEQVFVAPNLVMIMQQVARADFKDAPDRADRMVPGLGDVLRRMWSRSLDDRFASCEDAAEALEQLLLSGAASNNPLAAVEESTAKRKARKKRRKQPEKAGVLDFVSGLLGRKPPPKKRRRKKKRAEGRPEAQPNLEEPDSPADSEADTGSPSPGLPENLADRASPDSSSEPADEGHIETGELFLPDSAIDQASSAEIAAERGLLPAKEKKVVGPEDPPSAPALAALRKDGEDIEPTEVPGTPNLARRHEVSSSPQDAVDKKSASTNDAMASEPSRTEPEEGRKPIKTLFDPPTSEHFSIADEAAPELPEAVSPLSDSQAPMPSPEDETGGSSTPPVGRKDEDEKGEGEESEMDDFFFGDFDD